MNIRIHASFFSLICIPKSSTCSCSSLLIPPFSSSFKKTSRLLPFSNISSSSIHLPSRRFHTSPFRAERKPTPLSFASRKQKQLRPLLIPPVLPVSTLSNHLQVSTQRLMRDLTRLGFANVSPNYLLTSEYSSLIAEEYGFKVLTDSAPPLSSVKAKTSQANAPLRPPVVTLMGHVDHGKTTLLDALRKSTIAASEHGGITQKIGAFTVPFDKGSKSITFLDTPGHMAFEAMRKRGANIADIVVLVVAGDDGVKPQTVEAIKHIQSADAPVIIAITKCDRPGLQPRKVIEQLMNHGIQAEEYGGDTQVVSVSAKTGTGIDELEAAILTLAEILEIRSSPKDHLEGWVVESSIAKGVGSLATIVVKQGTLSTGMSLVADSSWGKVRSLMDVNNKRVKQVFPGQAVQVLGWKELPKAGDHVFQVKNESEAKEVLANVARRNDAQELYQLAESHNKQLEVQRLNSSDTLKSSSEDKPEYFNVIAKCDDTGSAEAIIDFFKGLRNDDLQTHVLYAAVGPITESDIERAETSNAILISFGVPVPKSISREAERHKVKVLFHNIIYHLMEDIRTLFRDRLPPILVQRVPGEASVQAIFDIRHKKSSVPVAGCRVTNGTLEKSHKVRLIRTGKIIWSGEIESLKHLKDEVTKIAKGRECGILLKGSPDFQVGDKIQSFTEEYRPPDF
ncbi:translation initiation factor IF-2Mt [Schizosaccharomyces cryophilus OY26]|uniref:Translation initiation factor IF-2, mitochondrial n=1 Tax=Schizosaccharomyces cryophilus (strain OY26 / ATCC MYA-4695 / CBS 11777 / NBRC 106824 / NRRL Y48691) TaxID=653667 RepID=S9W3K7_SCHCR|nr:translation initiation factor IF-2Mt [Schizosaccharomyces cryophilus OY26]EPY53129.1 translation initiation factor IF-2Mt [Schizosaccharomyces cryophilus OY26]